MMHGKVSMLAAAVTLAALGVSQSQASVTYRYVADKSNYTATAAGAPVTVDMYLQEVLTNGSSSILTKTVEDGLFSAAMKVDMLPGSGNAAITSVKLNPSFHYAQDATFTAGSGNISEALGSDQAGGSGIQLGDNGNGAVPSVANAVYLGQMTITSDSTGKPSVFRLDPYSSNGGNTLSDVNALDLDVSSTSAPAYVGTLDAANPAMQITVSTPEPASLSLLGLSAIGLLARRRKA